jgi:hypothetical protein
VGLAVAQQIGAGTSELMESLGFGAEGGSPEEQEVEEAIDEVWEHREPRSDQP